MLGRVCAVLASPSVPELSGGMAPGTEACECLAPWAQPAPQALSRHLLPVEHVRACSACGACEVPAAGSVRSGPGRHAGARAGVRRALQSPLQGPQTRARPVRAGTQRALRLIGPARTKLLLFTGRRLEGEQAVAWGLAELLADDPVQARACPIARFTACRRLTVLACVMRRAGRCCPFCAEGLWGGNPQACGAALQVHLHA